MRETIRTIRLYGKLGARFGRVHRTAVRSAAEAVRALGVLLPGFQQELASSKDRGVAYTVFLGKQNIGEADMHNPPGRDEIRIAPILSGSKRGELFQVLLGAAMIAVSLWNPAFLGMSASVVSGVGMMGASLALGGVMQLLSPQQRGLSTKDSPNNGASYSFNGPVNTSAQGNPVPVLYGRMIVGSAVISAGIYAEDQV